MNKILVTGAKGFIGKHLCLKLERLGYTVFKYDADSSKEELDNLEFSPADDPVLAKIKSLYL